jgi:hypothetical protein
MAKKQPTRKTVVTIWIHKVKEICIESRHLEVVFSYILMRSPFLFGLLLS